MNITVIDHLDPEATAMLQALYSRSPNYVEQHLARVEEVGADKFMEKFYCGYGHKSIGDCGTTTLFIEGVSMLAAKAIQNNQLYRGQEASTRYMDMSNAKMINPDGTERGMQLLLDWREIYSKVLHDVENHLSALYPNPGGEVGGQWVRAIRARAFDICRGFLPAGCATNLSWQTDLRQAADHLRNLTFHPLLEVREIAFRISESLREKYPSSFKFKTYPGEIEYHKRIHLNYYSDLVKVNFWSSCTKLDISGAKRYLAKIQPRPEKSELPNDMRRFGVVQLRFSLDYGSYRDFQRHRSITQNMPLLSAAGGWNEWYRSNIPDHIWDKYCGQISSLLGRSLNMQRLITKFAPYSKDFQYYVPMACNVVCSCFMPLNAAVYIAELRSQKTVHPTLRPIAQKLGSLLQDVIPSMDLYVDYSEDTAETWHPLGSNRGNQTIVEK